MKALGDWWRRQNPPSGPARVPDGVLIYAVGDVHGHDDLLEQLLARIEEDRAQRRASRTLLIFLGDLIDRGPGSAKVVERLRTYRPPGVETIFLMGNHEEVLLRVLEGDESLLPDWLRFGGADCARSYGLEPERLARMQPSQSIAALRQAIPADHVAFLDSFADTFQAGDYLFVHAGIRPGVPLAEQTQSDLRWIRAPFLQSTAPHQWTVVHGHTISREVDQAPFRVGIDTGAYLHGVLTALVLQGAGREIVQATAMQMDLERP